LKKFLFISHITPESKRSSLRQALFEIMQRSLHNQTYPNWKALWIGENERIDGRIKEVAIKKREDLSSVYLRKDVLDYINDCDYIIKLDDDDIIMPYVLEKASLLNFDCYCDLYHTFYDISSGILTQQKRAWIAATCIHKKEHAMTHQNGFEVAENFINSIFYGEHGRDWIAYYKNKSIIYSDRNYPIYVRVLSPTSITAGANKFPLQSIDDVDLNQYNNYLLQFGSWINMNLKEFNNYKVELKMAWEEFSHFKLHPIKGIKFTTKLKDIIKKFISK